MVRLQPDPEALKPSTSEIAALAELVRGIAAPRAEAPVEAPVAGPGNRGHLRLIPSH